jgi:SWI/SNF-related matrix-associated actin-dependent regulator of chromatin subfamily B member 1
LGTAGGEDDVRASFLPPLSTGARAIDQVSSFTPLLNYISDSEIEKTEREREKELIRRRKRNTRGRRGVALPDREPQRTYRTPAIGFPPVDPANLNQSVLMNQPTSRRAAAAAAQINIANMVASENRPEDRSPLGTPVMASMTLQTSASLASSQPAAAKEPKQKGLFKAPTIPQSVLKPRATISAPTPSTAASSTFLLKDGDLDEQPVVSMVDVTRVPENRGGPMNPKRARELEREAKEREYMDGQHANNIDGEWHCSNCGCPASIAVGRRKGPLGDKTQCGPCGKYWHRHRRPRPVEYHSDLAYHQNQRDEAARAKNAGRRRAASPASSESSASEAPLAEQIKKTDSRSSAAADTPADTEASAPPTQEKLEAPPPISRRPSSVIGGGSSKFVPYSAEDALENPAPEWLVTALTQLRERYPHDRLELMRLHRPSQETNVMDWRVKCDDCQEKVRSVAIKFII